MGVTGTKTVLLSGNISGVNVTMNISESPIISFTDPTPANGTILTQNFASINTTVLASLNTTAFIDWSRSLVGWWRFNNESGESPIFFRDRSSQGNNGTCSETTCPTSISGKFGNALGFDGSDDYLEVPDSPSLNPSYITVEAWFNAVNGTLETQKSLVQKPYTNHMYPYYQYLLSLVDTGNYTKQAGFSVTINGVLHEIGASNLNYNYGEWHYLVGTYDGSNVTLYLDGVLAATEAASGPLNSYNTALRFGSYPNLNKTSDYIFNGKIDEVRIHNRALSP